MKRQSLWWLAAALFLFLVSALATVALLGRARLQRRRFYRQLRNLGLPGPFARLLAAYWPARLLPEARTAVKRYEHGAEQARQRAAQWLHMPARRSVRARIAAWNGA